ncbi:cache domain-containing sensor histidine kinase [Lederbergia graminis]|uniref:Sensor histidine kinase n=1 Tax=Lederbergia graminis TaxID=735518 RepID=A0ABW0LKB5_9BACI
MKKIAKSIYQRYSQLSLQNKFVVLYVMLFMIPVIIIVFFYSNAFYKNAVKDSKEQNEYLMEMEKIHIEKNIETMRESAQMIASDDHIIDFISNRNERTVSELIEFQREHITKMVNVQTVNPSINHFRLFMDNESMYEMWPILYKESRIVATPWYSEVMNLDGKELWWLKHDDIDLLSNIKEERPKISLYRRINDLYGNHLGIIEISMLQSNFFPRMFSPISDGMSEMIVINNDEEIYTNPANNFLQDEKFSSEDYRIILDKLTDEEETDSFLLTNRHIPYLVVATYVKDIDVHMVNVISLQDIYMETKKARNVTLITAMVILFILSVLTYVIISLLLKKLYRLIDNMKQVEKGDFSTEINTDGHDEIAILAFHFKRMLSKINTLIADAVYKQAVTKDTELKALKTQIDSHFLYNTLENIKMMAEIEGKYEISDSITSLGEMMRYNIKWKNEYVVLSEEIAHIKNYVDIMNLRLNRPLSLVVDIPDQLRDQEILKLSLQPIIENAIKHGIEPNSMKDEESTIHVKAYLQHQTVIIEVTDNGVGMDTQQLYTLNRKINGLSNDQSTSEDGIGLRNVHERIALFYGKGYGISVKSVKNEYTSVMIRLPYLIIRGASRDA